MLKPRYFLPFRRIGNKKAVIFLHGLLGEVSIWERMATLLLADPELADWDIFSLGYRTTVVFHPFSEEWSLDNQCELLYPSLILPPIAEYESLAFVAHSAGGLMLQRILVDFDDVLRRTTHVFFFGTASTGWHRAQAWKFLNAQLRDMGTGSLFIQRLRQDWKAKFQGVYPFSLDVIAGENDTDSRIASVRQPFCELPVQLVPGDHTSMIKPASENARSFQIVKKSLLRPGQSPEPTDFGRESTRRSGKIFVSYSHKDGNWLMSITDVLTLILGRDSLNSVWDDRLIEAGDEWRKRIQDALARVPYAVLLVTQHFMTSQFIREVELPTLLKRHRENSCRLFPILVYPLKEEGDASHGIEPDARRFYAELSEIQFANDAKRGLAGVTRSRQTREVVRIANAIKSSIESDAMRRISS